MTKETDIKKLNMEARPYDKVLEKIMELCPAAVQNGKVDFDRLKAELSDVVDDDAKETYEFKWVGKNKALVEANKPIRKTLRPCKEESKNWDTTENLYIEGDNLEALKLLQEGYLGKIKMIYIDPPYNTGSDFVYHDNRVQSEEEMNEGIGLFDEEGNRQLSTSFVKNTETSGRFHSDWCTMMYPRLKLARDLLSDDGVIFISIDDNEVDNLLNLVKEIYGNPNTDMMMWRKSGVGRDGKMKNTTTFRKDHEYIAVCFKKEIQLRKSYETPNWENDYGNPDNDPRGNYKSGVISKKEEASNPKHKNYFTVTSPSGKTYTRQFDCSKSEFEVLDKDGRIYWGKNGDSVPSIKIFVNEKREVTTSSILDYKDMTTTQGSKTLEEILNINGIGSEMRPKPVALMHKLAQIGTINQESIILDFFSGSATTAHAVMQLNAEDGGNRKFIMVQLPEICDEKSEAFKAGYKNICEIGKERIRRAGDKIVQETGKTDLDIGFRVLKVDETNMQDVYYNPAELTQKTLLSSIDNIKTDRQPLDLLFGVMVDWGVSLTLPLQEAKVGVNTIHVVGDNDLVACFDNNVTPETITKMAELNPTRAVFRDACFAKDDAKINMFEIFKTICHWDDKKAKDNIRVM